MPSTWCVCLPPGVYAFHLVYMPSTWWVCLPLGVYAFHLVCMPSSWCVCLPLGVYAFHLVCMPSSWCVCLPLGVYAFHLVCMLSSWCVCQGNMSRKTFTTIVLRTCFKNRIVTFIRRLSDSHCSWRRTDDRSFACHLAHGGCIP